MLNEVQPTSPGINLRHRRDGGFFNLARFRAKSKTSVSTAHELQFANDNATPAQTIDDLHRIPTIYNASYQHFGIKVNTDKTNVLNQPPPGQTSSRANVGINGEHLDELDYFPHLGSILSKPQTFAKDIENSIKATHCAYGRLSHRVFNNHVISIRTKIMLFRAVVLSALLYACETWTFYRRDIKGLESFQQRKLRQLLNTQWELRLSNNEILKRAPSPLGRICRTDEPLQTASNHALRQT